MSTAKVIEVIGEGKSIEEAIKNTIKDVEETIKEVRQLDVKHIQAIVEKGSVVKYRINSNVTFVVKH